MNFLNKDYIKIFNQIETHKLLVAILIITVVVFSPIFSGSEFLTYDDNWYIYENENVINFSWDAFIDMFSSPLGGQYSPLGEVYNALLYLLFGNNASAFKIVALTVHLFNVFLLFHILKNLFCDKLLISLAVLLFAIHPMQVETIGWLSVMFRNAVFFMFLGYFFYFKYLNDNYKKYKLIPVIVCYVLACLFKEQAILFPVGVVLINMHKSGFKVNKRIVLETVFWGIMALIFGLFTIKIMRTGGPSLAGNTISLEEKFGVLSKTILEYHYNFLFPLDLSFSYPYPLVKLNNFSLIVTSALMLIGFSLFFTIKNKIFRFGFLWLFGFLSLSLALSFFSIRDTYMADRYVYIAIVGFSVLLYSILRKFNKTVLSKNLVLSILLGFSTFCAIVSFNRVSVFKDNKSLWTDALKVNPQNQYANNSLGFYYRKANNFEKAEHFYKKAIEIDSSYFLAHNNLGYVYVKQKKYRKAIFHFTKAITINQHYKNAYENRAFAAKKVNEVELLLLDLRKLIKFEPDNINYRKELVEVLFQKKDYSGVISEAIKLLQHDSSNRTILSYMARSYFHLKKYKEAIPLITNATKSEKNKGYYFFIRSVSYYQTGNLVNALKDVQSAQKLGYKVDSNYLNLIIREVKKSQ
ncbi:tetratricopeptide repeat protein [Aquimarina algicola]|uniref:Tetratricopeptide repeat protein n=1 Tax=Aquimarina algicola TaxID=2589995 RepID=A0A504J3K0_9FLAO|nr:tetratricopeptide repeat protein [Aquimarina algicola]TPN81649.1 tetratricopeptide repeat protein [Aquimarina algicola]